MSLISQPFAVPSRIKGAVRYLARERGQRAKRETAERLLSPPSLLQGEGEDSEPSDMICRTLDECVHLGLTIEDGDYIVLNPGLPPEIRNPVTLDAALPGTILDLITTPHDGPNATLALALAWFLGQDPLAGPGTWSEFGERLKADPADELLKFNDVRYVTFSHWARYLGVANVIATPAGQRLLPDPTGCLRRVLRDVFDSSAAELPVTYFVHRLASRCPLFEGGAMRVLVDNNTREPNHLSPSTSFALLRLEEDNLINMGVRSDAESLVLVDGPIRRPVSQINPGPTWGITQ